MNFIEDIINILMSCCVIDLDATSIKKVHKKNLLVHNKKGFKGFATSGHSD